MLKSKIARRISWVLLICCFAGACVFLAQNINYFLNSDMASELVLSELLVEEGRLLSSNWYYSTELYVVHTFLLFAPLMHLFESWHVVRVVGSVLWYAVLLASAWYVCRQARMKRAFPFAGILCMLPLSQPYADNVLIGIHYIPYMACSFCLFGMSLQFMHAQGCRRKTVPAVLGGALALAVGMGGMRLLLTLGLPTVCTAAVLLLRQKKQHGGVKISSEAAQFALITGLFFAAQLIGCLLNVAVLSRHYTFRTYNHLSFTEIAFPWTVLNDLIEFWGYRTGEAFSSVLLHNALAATLIVLAALSVVRCWKSSEVPFEQRALSVLYPAGIGIFLLLFSCTDSPYFQTYHLPISIFGFLTLVSGLNTKGSWILWQKAVAWLLVLAVIACGSLSYLDLAQTDKTEELRDLTEYLKEDGYEAGYGTFWLGNVLAELSDGQFEMYVFLGEDVADIDSTYKWLQRKSHDTQPPEGQVFVIIPSGALGNYAISDMLSPADMVYETENYLVYGYEDYDTMKESMAVALEEHQYY